MKFKTALTYLTITLSSILLGLLVSEIYIRVSGDYWALHRFRERSLEYETTLFARDVFPRRPQKAQRNPDVKFRINAHGFRGDSFPIKKPPGTVRIMVYGGSAAFDVLANQGRDWPHRIERKLNDEIDSRIHVINAGIPGHASFDSFGRFWTKGHRFNPDYVLIYHAWNDIKTFHSPRPLLRRFVPEEGRGIDRQGDPRIEYQNRMDRFVGHWSQLYLRLRLKYLEWKLNLDDEGRRPTLPSKDSPGRNLSPEAVSQFQFTLANFVDAVRNTGAVPVLMTQARLVTPQNTEEERQRIGYSFVNMSHATLVRAFELTDHSIQRVSQKEDVFLIDASGTMTGKNNLFDDHVHVTDTGSRTLAHLTASELAELLASGPAGN